MRITAATPSEWRQPIATLRTALRLAALAGCCMRMGTAAPTAAALAAAAGRASASELVAGAAAPPQLAAGRAPEEQASSTRITPAPCDGMNQSACPHYWHPPSETCFAGEAAEFTVGGQPASWGFHACHLRTRFMPAITKLNGRREALGRGTDTCTAPFASYVNNQYGERCFVLAIGVYGTQVL